MRKLILLILLLPTLSWGQTMYDPTATGADSLEQLSFLGTWVSMDITNDGDLYIGYGNRTNITRGRVAYTTDWGSTWGHLGFDWPYGNFCDFEAVADSCFVFGQQEVASGYARCYVLDDGAVARYDSLRGQAISQAARGAIYELSGRVILQQSEELGNDSSDIFTTDGQLVVTSTTFNLRDQDYTYRSGGIRDWATSVDGPLFLAYLRGAGDDLIVSDTSGNYTNLADTYAASRGTNENNEEQVYFISHADSSMLILLQTSNNAGADSVVFYNATVNDFSGTPALVESDSGLLVDEANIPDGYWACPKVSVLQDNPDSLAVFYFHWADTSNYDDIDIYVAWSDDGGSTFGSGSLFYSIGDGVTAERLKAPKHMQTVSDTLYMACAYATGTADGADVNIVLHKVAPVGGATNAQVF